MIDRILDWRWLNFVIVWFGGVAVMLATVLTGIAGASWILAIELTLLIGWTVWAIRYRRGWDND